MLDKTTEKIRRYSERIELLMSIQPIDYKAKISKLEAKICKLETIVSQN